MDPVNRDICNFTYPKQLVCQIKEDSYIIKNNNKSNLLKRLLIP